MEQINFKENYKKDIEKHIKKKQNFKYLSWSFVQKEMKLLDGDANWSVVPAHDNKIVWYGGFLKIRLTIFNKTEHLLYPILDFRNKPMPESDISTTDINNSQMRGFAKLFSMMTGIGLSIFTGEDLKMYDNSIEEETLEKIKTRLSLKADKTLEKKILMQAKVNKLEDLTKEQGIMALSALEEKEEKEMGEDL